jgi:hypothetical protein
MILFIPPNTKISCFFNKLLGTLGDAQDAPMFHRNCCAKLLDLIMYARSKALPKPFFIVVISISLIFIIVTFYAATLRGLTPA